MNLFRKKTSEKKEKEISIVGVTVIGGDNSELSESIVKEYRSKQKEIAHFLLDSGIEEQYDICEIEDLIEKLGTPIISVEMNKVSYPENTLDDEHIICFEYAEGFDKLFNCVIDG